jgi:hypothetical protein
MVVVAGAGLATAVIHPRLARSADHQDSPATMNEPAADINDVYTFLDGTSAVFAMTVFPAAPSTAKFSDAVSYVIHTSSGPGYGMANTDYDIICQFDTAQKASCWFGKDDYVAGDASGAAGLSTAGGKIQIFAGLRADPFFFNLDGFKDVVATVDGVENLLAYNDAGCPTLDNVTSSTLVNKLRRNPDASAPQVAGCVPGATDNCATPDDHFKKFNTLSIVVKIDKSLVTKGGNTIAVWGSTHKKS